METKVAELTKDLESSDGERKSLKQENKGLLIETTKQNEKVQFQQMQIMQLTDKITVSSFRPQLAGHGRLLTVLTAIVDTGRLERQAGRRKVSAV